MRFVIVFANIDVDIKKKALYSMRYRAFNNVNKENYL